MEVGMLLKDKVAIVTGAASLRGIGWATAKRFAEEGAVVALIDLDETAARDAAAEIGEAHRGYSCEVRDEPRCAGVLQRIIGELGLMCWLTMRV
jgi:NAD(P)-dependent dehydrogenase (short-subunit alcohol dehydrogenase family)